MATKKKAAPKKESNRPAVRIEHMSVDKMKRKLKAAEVDAPKDATKEQLVELANEFDVNL